MRYLTQVFVLVLLLFAFSISLVVNAYPEDQFKECILGVKQNPIILGVPEKSIEKFCDCALTLIVDEGKDDKASGIECTSKSFT